MKLRFKTFYNYTDLDIFIGSLGDLDFESVETFIDAEKREVVRVWYWN